MFTTAEGIRTTVDEFQVADIKAKTTLYRAVPAGATSITVGSLEGFQPGMTIRIDDAAAEEATIRDFGSDGVQRTLVLASPLASAHPVEATVYGYVVGRPFGAAVVREPRADIGIGPLLFVNNVDIGFDFTSLPFRPSSVDFAYRNYGGRENLSVDGSEVYRGEIGAAPNGMGGAHWSSADPEGDGSWIGTFNGPVDRFAVGGQEFALDQVCAHP